MRDCNGQKIERGARVLVFLDKPYVVGTVLEHRDGGSVVALSPDTRGIIPPSPHHLKFQLEVEIDIPFFGNKIAHVMRYPEPDKEVITAVPKGRE